MEKEKKEKILKEKIGTTKGYLKTRGRIFEGNVIKKFPRRVVISFERNIYVKKYERFDKFKTKIHARLPKEIEDQINVGDYVMVQECRPLSKIIHFMVIKKIMSALKNMEET